MVKEFIARVTKALATANASATDVLKQASALATVPQAQPKEQREVRIPYKQRQTYAEMQAEWEFKHNKKAQAEVSRRKSGFF